MIKECCIFENIPEFDAFESRSVNNKINTNLHKFILNLQNQFGIPKMMIKKEFTSTLK